MAKSIDTGLQSGKTNKKTYGFELPNTTGIYVTFQALEGVYDGLKDELGVTDMTETTSAKYQFPMNKHNAFNVWIKVKLGESSAGTDGKKATKTKYLRCAPDKAASALQAIQAKETITGLDGWVVMEASFCSHAG